jgi:hypothetical protein
MLFAKYAPIIGYVMLYPAIVIYVIAVEYFRNGFPTANIADISIAPAFQPALNC